MKYIVYRRFNTDAVCGRVDIPVFTVCRQKGHFICFEGKPLCVVTSENAHRYFMADYDGNGMARGDYITAVKMGLEKKPENWDKVLADEICGKYRRKEHKDHWLWNHDFYLAPIGDLEHIYNLVK